MSNSPLISNSAAAALARTYPSRQLQPASDRRRFACLSGHLGLAALVLAGAAALAPARASACGAQEPGLTSTVPADGGSFPANGALLFRGAELSLDAITVTVDGQPATLAPSAFAEKWADLAAHIEPQPSAGQSVAIEGTFCQGCEPTNLSFTVAAPDLEPPAHVPDAAFFAIFDHPAVSDTGCEVGYDLSVFVHAPLVADPEGAAAVHLRATWAPAGEAGPSVSALGAGEATALVLRSSSQQFPDKDVQLDTCVTITAFDLAGNEAPPLEVCPACFFRQEDGEADQSTPIEPEWSDADAVPGSACASGEDSTGSGGEETAGDPSETAGDPTEGPGDPTEGPGDPTDTGEPVETDGATSDADPSQDSDKGCACDARPTGGSSGALLVLLALVGLRRRTRA